MIRVGINLPDPDSKLLIEELNIRTGETIGSICDRNCCIEDYKIDLNDQWVVLGHFGANGQLALVWDISDHSSFKSLDCTYSSRLGLDLVLNGDKIFVSLNAMALVYDALTGDLLKNI